jgi:ornithine cyclodeaminase/alanine dehydrogenase-like protein (mu-crystallin family)
MEELGAFADTADLRYLSAAEVLACLPPLAERLELAARALTSLSRGEAEMPAKIGVHPREGTLLHAMPAWDRRSDLVGLKWVSAFPGNAAVGLPAIHALIVLNDAATGAPLCLMDGTHITTVRTAAVSGVALRCFAPEGARRVALIGAGVQARGHLPVVAHLLPRAEVRVFDRHPERAADLAARAAGLDGVAAARAAATAREAVRDAEVVLTMGALGSMRQVMTPDWLAPGGLVVAVDFATYVSAELARSASVFATDEREQFLAYREHGDFDGFPEPTTTLGEAVDRLAAGEPLPRADGTTRVVVCHLGVGLADVIFADAVRRAAEARGVGTLLRR